MIYNINSALMRGNFVGSGPIDFLFSLILFVTKVPELILLWNMSRIHGTLNLDTNV